MAGVPLSELSLLLSGEGTMEGVYSDGTDTGQQVCQSVSRFLSSVTPPAVSAL